MAWYYPKHLESHNTIGLGNSVVPLQDGSVVFYWRPFRSKQNKTRLKGGEKVRYVLQLDWNVNWRSQRKYPRASFSHGRVKLKYADKVRDGMKALLLPSSDYACLGAGISIRVSTYTFAMSSCLLAEECWT